jgi:hypothetical protein
MLQLPALERCTINDLAKLPLILPRSPHSIRVMVDRLCAGNKIQPNIIYESDSVRSTKGIVELGFGCTIFSAGPLREDIAAGRLVAIPFSSPLMSWTLALVHARREHLSLAVRTVKRLIIDQVIGMVMRHDQQIDIGSARACRHQLLADARSAIDQNRTPRHLHQMGRPQTRHCGHGTARTQTGETEISHRHVFL